ncbi:hypothetical protein [Mycolicibacterium llatzerense]|nr:hypothetical protein [Mycolicibacterium llatzerense]
MALAGSAFIVAPAAVAAGLRYLSTVRKMRSFNMTHGAAVSAAKSSH